MAKVAGDGGKRIEQVASAVGEAVKARHQQYITGGEPGEHLAQRRTVRLGATCDFTVHFDRACGGQCRDLRRDALAVCRDSRIAVDHASVMHLSFAQRKGNQIK
jgi:hypothetical protein